MSTTPSRIWMTSIPQERPRTPRLVSDELVEELRAHPGQWTAVRDYNESGAKVPRQSAKDSVARALKYVPPLPPGVVVKQSRGVLYAGFQVKA